MKSLIKVDMSLSDSRMFAATTRGNEQKNSHGDLTKKSHKHFRICQGSTISTAAKLQSCIQPMHPPGSLANTERHFSVHQVNRVKMMVLRGSRM